MPMHYDSAPNLRPSDSLPAHFLADAVHRVFEAIAVEAEAAQLAPLSREAAARAYETSLRVTRGVINDAAPHLHDPAGRCAALSVVRALAALTDEQISEALAHLGPEFSRRLRATLVGNDLSRLTCRALLPGDGSAPLCGEPATRLLTAACLHGHVVPSLACDAHAEDARERKITCTECGHGREPHSCPVTVEFVSLREEGSRP